MSFLKADEHCRRDGKSVSLRETHVRECERLIEQRYSKPDMSIGRVAETLHLSRAYLRNLFIEFNGMPPQRYLMDVRMKKAAGFLLSSDLPVGVIASSVGYTDQLQFSKLFKKYYGCTPTAYRACGGKRT